MATKRISISSKGLNLTVKNPSYTATAPPITPPEMASSDTGVVIQADGFRFAPAQDFYGKEYKRLPLDVVTFDADDLAFRWDYGRLFEDQLAIQEVAAFSISTVQSDTTTISDIPAIRSQPRQEDVALFSEEAALSLRANYSDTASFSEEIVFNYSFFRYYEDTSTISDISSRHLEKPFEDTSTLSDVTVIGYGLRPFETANIVDTPAFLFRRPLEDTFYTSDEEVISFWYGRIWEDTIGNQELLTTYFDKGLIETVIVTDSPSLGPNLAQGDTATLSDDAALRPNIGSEDIITPAEEISFRTAPVVLDAPTIIDQLQYAMGAEYDDAFSTLDTAAILTGPSADDDSFSVSDDFNAVPTKGVEELLAMVHEHRKLVDKVVLETVAIEESATVQYGLNPADIIAVSDVWDRVCVFFLDLEDVFILQEDFENTKDVLQQWLAFSEEFVRDFNKGVEDVIAAADEASIQYGTGLEDTSSISEDSFFDYAQGHEQPIAFTDVSAIGFNRPAAGDQFAISEFYALAATKKLDDTSTISEIFTYSAGKGLVDTTTVSDTITFFASSGIEQPIAFSEATTAIIQDYFLEDCQISNSGIANAYVGTEYTLT